MAQRFEGKNLDEVLTMAAEAFGVQRVQLTYHVVLEKLGFLGGFKRLIIEAEINDAALRATDTPDPLTGPKTTLPPSSRGSLDRQGLDRGRGRRRGGNGAPRSSTERVRGDGPPQDYEDGFRIGDFERFAGEVPEQGPESEQATSTRSWYKRLLDLAGLQFEIRTEENQTQVVVRLFGDDALLLTQEHGELLDALQILGNKALVGGKIEKEIELNCEAFKERRAEQLAEKAQEVAEQVRRSGREQLLPAMTPIERRLVHLALQDDADITTQSRGEGFYKRVAIVIRRDSSVNE